jgi:hypothetical protein
LPPKVTTKTISETQNIVTLAGKIQGQGVKTLRDLSLSEFDKNWCISQQKACVFDKKRVKCNIILGTNFLVKAGIKLNYSINKMAWFDCSILLHLPADIDAKHLDEMEDMFFVQAEDELFSDDWLNCFATKIRDAKYEWIDVADVVNKLTGLNAVIKQICFDCYM